MEDSELIALFSEKELAQIIRYFASDLCATAARMAHKSPSSINYYEQDDDDFSPYEMWELSCKTQLKIQGKA